MKDLNSPITLFLMVPYQKTTLLSRVALERSTNIHGLHAVLSFPGQVLPIEDKYTLNNLALFHFALTLKYMYESLRAFNFKLQFIY